MVGMAPLLVGLHLVAVIVIVVEPVDEKEHDVNIEVVVLVVEKKTEVSRRWEVMQTVLGSIMMVPPVSGIDRHEVEAS